MQDGKFNLFNLFSESLKLITHCPACKVRYNASEAKVVEERADYSLVHLTCRSCHKGILAVVAASNYGVNSVGMISDLTSEDVMRFRRSAPLTADDVLELHESLSREPAILDQL